MKKILTAILAAAAIVALSSCNAKESGQTENNSVEATAENISGTPLYTEAASAFSSENGDAAIQPPSEEFLRNVFSIDSSRVIFSIDSSGTYLSFMDGMLYTYTNADRKEIYDILSKELSREYYEADKEHINELNHISSYDEYKKLIEEFWGEECMQAYREYDPDNLEAFVHFEIVPEHYEYGFSGESSDYSDEEVFLRTVELVFERFNDSYSFHVERMKDRIESGDNFYVIVTSEYIGDNIIRITMGFDDEYNKIVISWPHKGTEYTMDESKETV